MLVNCVNMVSSWNFVALRHAKHKAPQHVTIAPATVTFSEGSPNWLVAVLPPYSVELHPVGGGRQAVDGDGGLARYAEIGPGPYTALWDEAGVISLTSTAPAGWLYLNLTRIRQLTP